MGNSFMTTTGLAWAGLDHLVGSLRATFSPERPAALAQPQQGSRWEPVVPNLHFQHLLSCCLGWEGLGLVPGPGWDLQEIPALHMLPPPVQLPCDKLCIRLGRNTLQRIASVIAAPSLRGHTSLCLVLRAPAASVNSVHGALRAS